MPLASLRRFAMHWEREGRTSILRQLSNLPKSARRYASVLRPLSAAKNFVGEGASVRFSRDAAWTMAHLFVFPRHRTELRRAQLSGCATMCTDREDSKATSLSEDSMHAHRGKSYTHARFRRGGTSSGRPGSRYDTRIEEPRRATQP